MAYFDMQLMYIRQTPKWRGMLDSVERITVLAMVQRRVEDSGKGYRDRCKSEQWEIHRSLINGMFHL